MEYPDALQLVGAFNPVHGALGGLILGIATAAQLLLTGRVLGLSGAVKGVLKGQPNSHWRMALLAGMLAASVPMGLYMPSTMSALPATYTFSRAVAGGLLVGLGSSMGNGCTSGHGICGLARFSLRSLVYTLTFMASGAAVSTLAGSAAAAGVDTSAVPALVLPGIQAASTALSFAATAVAAFTGIAALARRASASALPTLETLASGLIGATFGVGLALSGMTLPAKVLAFLSPTLRGWDPSLAFVMASALAVATPVFQAVLRSQKRCGCAAAGKAAAGPPLQPMLTTCYSLPTSSLIDWRLVLGGVLFGAGWGLSGMCPGPAIVAFGGSVGLRVRNVAAGVSMAGCPCLCSKSAAYLVSMAAGMLLEGRAFH